jgi:hypothetical protein
VTKDGRLNRRGSCAAMWVSPLQETLNVIMSQILSISTYTLLQFILSTLEMLA